MPSPPTEAEKQGAFDLNEAVEAALRFTAHELKGIEVIQALPAPAMVLGSKSHLTQVLINLLANAAKAIGAVTDGRAGFVRIEGEEREGRLWVLAEQPDHIAPHQRLSPGDAQLNHPKLAEAAPQPGRLLQGEELAAGEELHVLRHAVATTQVAAVGHREPHVDYPPAKAVDELGG